MNIEKKTIASLFILFCTSVSVFGQVSKWNQRYQDYVDQYKDIAIEEMHKYKIPASITLAQGLLESGGGSSTLAIDGNNHFGIKCHGWQGRTVYRDDDAANECFRAYDTAKESFEDHSKFLAGSQRYRSLFMLSSGDYKGWAHGLKSCGYATNPQYAYRLIEIIELYQLHQYDGKREARKEKREKTSEEGKIVLHPIHLYNKNYYLKARRGDTFDSIAEEVGGSARAIARHNERNRKDKLEEGDIIWLKKKRSCLSKQTRKMENRFHVVKNGESMYDVSQRYGIRLKSLYKLNGLTPDYQIKVGDRIRIY